LLLAVDWDVEQTAARQVPCKRAHALKMQLDDIKWQGERFNCNETGFLKKAQIIAFLTTLDYNEIIEKCIESRWLSAHYRAQSTYRKRNNGDGRNASHRRGQEAPSGHF